MSEFVNESPIDFSIADEQEKYAVALADVKKSAAAGKFHASLLINGEKIRTENIWKSRNPSDSYEILGEVSMADESHTEKALQSITSGQTQWARIGFAKRAEILDKLADLLTHKRYPLSALITLEAGKPWAEADADVCEAIDFCRYYATIARKMGRPAHLQPEILGETNHLRYTPRGPSVVIAPWNFPLAIATGMTVAALVTGNTTILKPAEQTSLIAYELAELIYEAGVPGDAFAFLPGEGEIVGRALVRSPDIHLICFTGSRPVGLEILKTASEVREGQTHIKRTILELGGKNALIVDSDADFDEAIKATLYSAFAFAGQKCSACSRLIVVGDAYEPFIERLTNAASDLFLGSAEEPQTFVGPLIDQVSKERVERTCEIASQTLNLAYQSETPEGGYYVPITIYRDVPADHEIWREEQFAPVLACQQAKDFESAIIAANDSQYALTGGAFSRSPTHLDMAREQLEVGNLYLNRSITGAIVGRQPFGGFKLSGVGSKAGGPDYLQQFVEARTATENTMRKGFTPELAV